ncbi:MAG: sigma-70 family RNA polymerase sigma factor [Solirubrobacterales bacterium]
MHDVYLSVINAVKLYNPVKNSFTTYCTNGIVNNFKALLKGQIKHFREVQDEGILNSKICDFTLEDEIIAYEETLNLKKAMEKLNLQEQNILNLVYVKGLKLKEAAALSQVKYRTAIEIRKTALSKLKELLKNKSTL